VISDAHPGLVDAIASTLAGAVWQRCRTHFLRNLLTQVPKSAGPFVATLVRSIFAQPDAEAAWPQFHRVMTRPASGSRRPPRCSPKRAPTSWRSRRSVRALEADLVEQPARAPEQGDPSSHRRRRDLPGPRAAIRLIGMVLAEQHDEWQVVRRYMSADSLTKARLEVVHGEGSEEVRGELVAAS
jgi:transposase-like protein